MKTCELCRKGFLTSVRIDGIRRNLGSRKYCLLCSPRGRHNTKKLDHPKNEQQEKPFAICKCGQTNPSAFYNRKDRGRIYRRCKECHNKICKDRQKKNIERVLNYMGGECMGCGFCKWSVVLDIHHIDPTEKHKHFKYWRGWTWKKIKEELSHCMLLCGNCHRAHHYGYDVFQGRSMEDVVKSRKFVVSSFGSSILNAGTSF